MTNKLTFEQAVRSGKDFRCVETGEEFLRKHDSLKHEISVLLTPRGELKIFSVHWLNQAFELIEVKKEFTAREIEAAFFEAWKESSHGHGLITYVLKKLGF